MNRTLVCVLLLAVTAFSFEISLKTKIVSECCLSCQLPLIKYFSLSNHRCGEGCFNPKDYPKYKIFEPGLTKADTNTPCIDRNYPVFNGTYTH